MPAACHRNRECRYLRSRRPWVEDLTGLLGLVEIWVVEVHSWGATVDDIEHPDTLVFDLDPGEGVEWGFIVDTAFRLRDTLAAEGHDCWPKTTEGKGLHVMVPIKPDKTWDTAHDHTRDIAEQLAATARDRYVTSALVPRPAKLFIDLLRNGRGTTAIGAYSPRARPGFPIAAPVTWRQIEHGLRSPRLVPDRGGGLYDALAAAPCRLRPVRSPRGLVPGFIGRGPVMGKRAPAHQSLQDRGLRRVTLLVPENCAIGVRDLARVLRTQQRHRIAGPPLG